MNGDLDRHGSNRGQSCPPGGQGGSAVGQVDGPGHMVTQSQVQDVGEEFEQFALVVGDASRQQPTTALVDRDAVAVRLACVAVGPDFGDVVPPCSELLVCVPRQSSPTCAVPLSPPPRTPGPPPAQPRGGNRSANAALYRIASSACNETAGQASTSPAAPHKAYRRKTSSAAWNAKLRAKPAKLSPARIAPSPPSPGHVTGNWNICCACGLRPRTPPPTAQELRALRTPPTPPDRWPY